MSIPVAGEHGDDARGSIAGTLSMNNLLRVQLEGRRGGRQAAHRATGGGGGSNAGKGQHRVGFVVEAGILCQ
jgi:hypothetical protein